MNSIILIIGGTGFSRDIAARSFSLTGRAASQSSFKEFCDLKKRDSIHGPDRL